MAVAGEWRIVAGSAVLLAAFVALPGFAGNGDAADLLFWSHLVTAVWFIALIFAVGRFRWRRLLLLIGAPIVLFWPIVFKLMEYECQHNVRACI